MECLSQGAAGDRAIYEPRRGVDLPVAGVINSGKYSVYALSSPGGSLMLEFSAGFFKDFNAGISFGGKNIVGSGKAAFQNYPGINARYRFIDESLYFPAAVLGFDLQGRDKYYNEFRRFATMSPGIFLVLSKAFRWNYGHFFISAGINYSFEPPESDRSLNYFGSIEHNFLGFGSACLEYNNTSDDLNRSIMKFNGMLNLAFKFSLIRGLTLEFQMRDLLENYTFTGGFTRNIGLEYITSF